jgi:hypothetical protein
MNSNYRRAATLYSLDIWVFFTNISVNTLHKGGDDDDDDNDNDDDDQFSSQKN